MGREPFVLRYRQNLMRASVAVALVVSALIPSNVRACVWSYGTTLRGEKISISGLAADEIIQSLRDFDSRSVWESRERSSRPRAGADHYQRNDYAVTLMHLGRANEAVALLTEIERTHPNSYVTASNLGTAYELAGDNGEALKWIREAIRRNEDAHEGTEWLHVRILEAKIAAARDREWFQRNSVLGLDFGKAAIPSLPARLPSGNSSKPVTLDELKNAIWYQLDERYQFVAPPDPVVANILFDWANLLFRTDALESAIAVYREALRYGVPQAELAKTRLRRAEQALRDHVSATR